MCVVWGGMFDRGANKLPSLSGIVTNWRGIAGFNEEWGCLSSDPLYILDMNPFRLANSINLIPPQRPPSISKWATLAMYGSGSDSSLIGHLHIFTTRSRVSCPVHWFRAHCIKLCLSINYQILHSIFCIAGSERPARNKLLATNSSGRAPTHNIRNVAIN